MGGPPRPAAHRPRGRGAWPAATAGRGGRRLPRRPAGAVGARPARGARPRLGRPAPVRAEPRTSLSRPGRAAPARRAQHRSAVPERLGARRRRSASASSTRRPPRSASSATTPARCAPRSPPTTLLRLALSQPDARARPCSATPGGRASASSPSPTATRSTARSSSRSGGAPYVVAVLNGDVDNHADLKVAPRPAHRRPDHHRRQGHPGGRWPATLASRRRDLGRGVPPHGRRVRGLVAIGAAAADRARPRCFSPCGAAARRCTSASPRTATSSPASRTASSRRRSRYLRMDGETPSPSGSRGQVVVLDGAQAGELDGHPAHGLRRHRAAGDRRPTSPPPRSRPATSTAATPRTTC